MRTVPFLLLICMFPLVSPRAAGQQPTTVELGIHAGATILIPGGGDAEVVFGVPGAGSLAGLFPPIYATVFATPSVMIEPQIAFLYETGSTSGLLNAALQVGYVFNPETPGSLYLAAHLQTANGFGNGGNTEFAAGGSVGYRRVVKDILAVRLEGRYRRWFDFFGLNEIAIIVGFGAALH
jgi:hypothetical protein